MWDDDEVIRQVVALVALALSAGCAKILDIDGEYVALEEDRSSANGMTGGQGGGMVTDASSGTGASSDACADCGSPTSASTGPPPPPPPPVDEPCPVGLYEGTFRGTHNPGFTVVGVPFALNGTVRFRLSPADGDRLTVIDGVLDGDLFGAAIPGGQSSTITAALATWKGL